MIMSLLSLVPLIFFYLQASAIAGMSDVANANDGYIKETLSLSLSNIKILIPFVIGVFVWVVNTAISAYAISKGKIRFLYGFASSILGGLGIHFVISLIYLIDFKKAKPNRIVVASIASISSVALVVAPLAIIVPKKTFESPVIGKQIKVSFNKSNPNLIEIFSDGLDLHSNAEVILDNPNLKDFYNFENYSTAGAPTHLSKTMLNSGFENYNPFKVLHDYNIQSNEEYSDKVYGELFLETGISHMHNLESSFSSRNLINPLNYADSSAYGMGVSSNPAAIVKRDPSLNITNWSGARDANAGSWGISDKAPDSASYEWLSKNIIGDQQTDKGARIYIGDLLTHRSFSNSSTNTYSTFNFSRNDQVNNWVENISNVINSLRNIKNSANHPSNEADDAYDNSMIIIYGDHASHDFIPTAGATDEDNKVRKAESALLIKYPGANANTNNRIVRDRAVWGPQLNEIIEDGIKNHRSNPLEFFNDHKFDLDIERPMFLMADKYAFVKWSNEKQLADGSVVRELEINHSHPTIEGMDSNGIVHYQYSDEAAIQKQLLDLKGVK